MDGSRDRQGYIGDITTKSVSELKDLLNRKETLLEDRFLLQKLPDKGRKIQEFVNKLKRLIEEKSHGSTSVMEVSNFVNANVEQHEVAPATDFLTAAEMPATDYIKSRQPQSNVQSSMLPTDELTSDCTLVLSDRMQNISIDKKKENVKTEEQFTNSYEKIIQRDNELLVNTKEKPKFVPNKSFKSRDSQSIKQESSYHNRERHRIEEESAVHPPQYKHQESKLISLNESIQLTVEQHKKREDLAIERATMRLLGQTSTKMEVYDPPATDMNYREAENHEDPGLDSDDDCDDES